MVNENGESTVLCAPESFESVKAALIGAGFASLSDDVVMRPANRVAVAGDVAEALHDLFDWLDELDDVQDVYHNAALPVPT